MSVREVKFYRVKEEVRILGIDDGPFDFRKDKEALLVGTIFRGGRWLDGILTTKIKVDGFDVTGKIISLVKKTRHQDLRVIMLDGLTFGGFNLANIEKIFQKTGLPVIVVIRKVPDLAEIKKVLKKFDRKREEHDLKCLEKAGKVEKVETRKGKFIYIQTRGINLDDARKLVKLSATRSLIPEPIRVAHLIASGMVLGESRGGA